MIFVGFAIGIVIGSTIGIGAICLVMAGKKADEAMGINDLNQTK